MKKSFVKFRERTCLIGTGCELFGIQNISNDGFTPVCIVAQVILRALIFR
jgi:hypothetical protein